MKNTLEVRDNRRGSRILDGFSGGKLAVWLFVILFALALQGCGNISSTVQTIQPVGGGVNAGNPFVSGDTIHLDGELDQPMTFKVTGVGTCKRMFINFGDGTTPLELLNADLSSTPTFTHTYSGWNGQKTVWAYGNWSDGCGGSVKIPIRVGPVVFKLGYKPMAYSACSPIPGKPPVRKNSVVTISDFNAGTPPDDLVVIDFGCLGGCNNKAFGLINTVAGPGYPFPGLRERSLVIKVGTQAEQSAQSSIAFSFTTNQAGPLEFCVNDYKLDDNTGGWGIGISIDETAAE